MKYYKAQPYNMEHTLCVCVQQEIFYFMGLSDFGHFSPAMARDEIMEFTHVPSTVVCICFLILQFGQGLLGQNKA